MENGLALFHKDSDFDLLATRAGRNVFNAGRIQTLTLNGIKL